MWGAVAVADEHVAEIRAGTVGSGPTRIVRARSRAGQRAAVFAHRAEHAEEHFRVLVRGSRTRGSRKPVRRRLRKPVRRRLRKPARACDIARDIALSIAVVLFAERGEIANGGVSMNRSSASIQRREETHASVPQSRRRLANRVRQSNDAHVTWRGGPRGRVGAPRVSGSADGQSTAETERDGRTRWTTVRRTRRARVARGVVGTARRVRAETTVDRRVRRRRRRGTVERVSRHRRSRRRDRSGRRNRARRKVVRGRLVIGTVRGRLVIGTVRRGRNVVRVRAVRATAVRATAVRATAVRTTAGGRRAPPGGIVRHRRRRPAAVRRIRRRKRRGLGRVRRRGLRRERRDGSDRCGERRRGRYRRRRRVRRRVRRGRDHEPRLRRRRLRRRRPRRRLGCGGDHERRRRYRGCRRRGCHRHGCHRRGCRRRRFRAVRGGVFLTVRLRGKRVVIVRLFRFPRRLRRCERGFESGAGRVRVVRGDNGGVVRGVHRRRVVRRRRLRGRGGHVRGCR